MRALVIGGTGFIGSCVVRQLASRDVTVAVYHRGRTRTTLPGGVREIIDPQSHWPIVRFPRKVFDFRPDLVIHTMMMGNADGTAFSRAFAGRTARVVMLSSGDVYRAYGRLTRIEPGPADNEPLSEDAPLRTVHFPYRSRAQSSRSLEYWYEKILAETAVLSCPEIIGLVLRLPKVYGPGSNDDLASVYRYSHQPAWRWTHGYVENVAAAIVLAATAPVSASRIYNVGEPRTPTIAERLATMPASNIEPHVASDLDFSHDISYDTSRIRDELGYREVIAESEARLLTLAARNT